MDFAESYTIEKAKERVAVEYVAEMLRLTVNNTSNSENSYTMEKSLKDLLEPPREEQRTSEEIIDEIKQKLAKLGA